MTVAAFSKLSRGCRAYAFLDVISERVGAQALPDEHSMGDCDSELCASILPAEGRVFQIAYSLDSTD